jgi:aldehyde dehydrogenase (NAD+)
MKAAIVTYYDEACEALGKDLGKSYTEASAEMEVVKGEVETQLANIQAWMAPVPKPTHMLLTPGCTELRRDPFGVVLVLAPFNYPMNLGLVPLIGALAAGNTVVLKPSEQTRACERWFVERLGAALPANIVGIVPGDVPKTTVWASNLPCPI